MTKNELASDSKVMSVAFSPKDANLLASGDNVGTITLWQINATGVVSAQLRAHTASVESIEFSTGGTMLASGSADAAVRLWRINELDPTPITTIMLPTGVNAVTLSSDGKWLATGSDETVRLWQLASITTSNIISFELSGHSDLVTSVAFSPNSKNLASGSRDRTVRLWQVDNLAAVPVVLGGHDWYVSAVSFSPDGKKLASADEYRSVRIWTVSLEGLKDKACAVAGRNLTQNEWKMYFPDKGYQSTCPQLATGE